MEQAHLLDRGPTFVAYESGRQAITRRLELLRSAAAPVDLALADPEGRLELTAADVAWLSGLYPAPALARIMIVLDHVRSLAPRWMSYESAHAPTTRVTEDAGLALSPLAPALGHITWSDDKLSAIVDLFDITQLPEIPPDIRLIAQVFACVHELAHTILTPEWRLLDVGLTWPDRRAIRSRTFVRGMARTALRHPPISRYAAAYRTRAGAYISDAGDPDVRLIACEEELADLIAAYLLGFTVTPAGQLDMRPFADREDQQHQISIFLAASRQLAVQAPRARETGPG